MAMALEEGVITENSTFYCGGSMTGIPGRTTALNCWKHAGHGTQTLKQAAQHSCNVAFVNIGLSVGADLFYDYVEAFGLWDKTGIDLSGESSTRSLWWSDSVFKDPTNKSQLAAASFGQTFNVTPIQMITAVSAAVNGGYLMEPYIVSQITDADGEIVYSKEPTVVRQVISEETSKTVASILEAVVGESEGTGKNAYVAGYRVGGKTGTTTKTAYEAETGVKEYMVSFCGIAPADDPEIAVLVVLDNPAPTSESGIYISGGVMAAPAVGRIMSEVLPYLGVEPIYTNDEEALLDVTMPKVVGSTVEEATTALENRGFTVRVVGDGETVTDQLPSANMSIASSSSVIIYAGGEKKTDEVTVPNLNGMTFDQAKRALANVGLFMDTSGALPTSSSIIVSRQSVASGEQVEYGSIISVTLVDKSSLGYY
jgi:stage V sporulation protein D (sporulation-specific penicillin-binding protein)